MDPNDELATRSILPRRSRLGRVALVSLAIASLVGAAVLAARGGTRRPSVPRYEWLFVYVMAYDNNLDFCTRRINEALARGVTSERVAVAVLSDGRDRDGLVYRLVTRHRDYAIRAQSEDITAPRSLASFLDWAVAAAPARRHVVVFLDHGGRLDEMGFDDHTQATDLAGASGPRVPSLSARATGDVLRAWRHRRSVRDVPLVFLQQCGRASVENVYNFRDTADAVLASQMNVGACNTYYEALLGFVARTPHASPRELTRVIAENDSHYGTYALFDGRAISALPARTDALARTLLEGAPDTTSAGPRASLAGLAACFRHGPEANYDLLGVVRGAARLRGPNAVAAAEDFARWVSSQLVIAHPHREGAYLPPGADAWCGASMHIPNAPSALDEYQELPLYRETRWDDLARALSQ